MGWLGKNQSSTTKQSNRQLTAAFPLNERSMMKIITLNIQHGGGKRISKIADYLRSLDVDMIVLTEFRENANAQLLRSSLATAGFAYFAAASIAPKENSVCIFSKHPFVPRTYPALSKDDGHRLLSAHFEKLAIFGVYFPLHQKKLSLFQFLINGDYKPVESAHIFLGDFNTGLYKLDESGSTFYCTEQFAALPESGLIDSWRSRNPEGREFSWYSNAGNGFRLDHVFSSPDANSKIQNVYYDHLPRESRITDHSALLVEYDG